MPVDTSKIQLSSVVLFMEQLGYTYLLPTKSFESGLRINRGRKYISLRVAVLLHNNFYTERHGIPTLEYPFESMPWKWVVASKQAKIVTSVSLQHSHRKGVICQKHWCKFADTENGKLFKAKFM